jgi:hypothetical protein
MMAVLSSNEWCSQSSKLGGLCQFGINMCDFFLLLLYEFIEIVECVGNGGKIEEMGDEFVVSSEKFEDLVAIGIVFNIAPEFISSKGYGLLGHRQIVWSGSKLRGGLGDGSCPHSAFKSSQASIKSQIPSHSRSNRHSSSARK